jgi:hypothetical protein
MALRGVHPSSGPTGGTSIHNPSTRIGAILAADDAFPGGSAPVVDGSATTLAISTSPCKTTSSRDRPPAPDAGLFGAKNGLYHRPPLSYTAITSDARLTEQQESLIMESQKPGMFKLLHSGESVGQSMLESGDPEAYSVSGLFLNAAGAKALAGWIRSVGGSEEEGAVYIELNEDFDVQDGEGQSIPFAAGTLISVPAEEEAFVELTGIPPENYVSHFKGHIAAISEGP